MKKERIAIGEIPAILWGEKSEKVFLAIHGDQSHKEDTVIDIFSKEAVKKGYQVISFDLPEHGERKNEKTLCKVQICEGEIHKILNYMTKRWDNISLFGCSLGAYFALLACQDTVEIQRALFLSPVVDMKKLIETMMTWASVTPALLREKGEIVTDFAKILYWDYYAYVVAHPIVSWRPKTAVLYGGKDNLCPVDTVRQFTERFHCSLEVLKDGEHFFHTKEQLQYFARWLNKEIV